MFQFLTKPYKNSSSAERQNQPKNNKNSTRRMIDANNKKLCVSYQALHRTDNLTFCVGIVHSLFLSENIYKNISSLKSEEK